jgi:hypothetical protein
MREVAVVVLVVGILLVVHSVYTEMVDRMGKGGERCRDGAAPEGGGVYMYATTSGLSFGSVDDSYVLSTQP